MGNQLIENLVKAAGCEVGSDAECKIKFLRKFGEAWRELIDVLLHFRLRWNACEWEFPR